MAQSRTESTWEINNYGKCINQFPPNTIKSIRQYERINKKICRQKMSIMFKEICINEEMLPIYRHTHTHTHTHIYIYIYNIYIYILQRFLQSILMLCLLNMTSDRWPKYQKWMKKISEEYLEIFSFLFFLFFNFFLLTYFLTSFSYLDLISKSSLFHTSISLRAFNSFPFDISPHDIILLRRFISSVSWWSW